MRVRVEQGRPVEVTGDRENPLYRGFCCVKGRNQAAVWASPRRLLRSQKRQPDGSHIPIPAEQAMDEIAERIQHILAEHGPRSVATYSGTMATNAGAANGAVTSAWLKAIGSRMGFNSNTIDQPGKMVAAALFGSWMAPPTPFSQARVALLVGCNPLVAMSGGIPHTNPGRTLTDALRSGLELIVIDPRRSETARRASLHLQARPGEDVAILACLIRTILAEELHDADRLDLLVQIDDRMSATAKLADYVIAVKHPFEMPGMSLTQEYLSAYAIGFGTTAAWAHYTPALVEPPEDSDLPDDWRFFYGLAQRMGLQLVIKPVSFSGTVRVPGTAMDMEQAPSTDELFDIVTRGSRIPQDEVRRHPAGALFPDPPVLVEPAEEGWKGRLDAGNPTMMAELAAVAGERARADERRPFRLVSRMSNIPVSVTRTAEPEAS